MSAAAPRPREQNRCKVTIRYGLSTLSDSAQIGLPEFGTLLSTEEKNKFTKIPTTLGAIVLRSFRPSPPRQPGFSLFSVDAGLPTTRPLEATSAIYSGN